MISTKVITIESTIWERKGIECVERGKEWSLWLNAETTLKDIEGFYEVSEAIFKDCIKAHKKGLDYQLEVSVHVDGEDVQHYYDRWVSNSRYDQDGEGIYLSADTRYTDAVRDIYLTKNVRKDLAMCLY